MRAKLRMHVLSSGEAGSEALRPAARDGVVRDAVLPRCGPWPGGGVGSEVTCCRIRCSRWRRCVGASIHSRVRGAWRRARRPRRRAMIRGDSSDEWICVIAIAIMRTQGAARERSGA